MKFLFSADDNLRMNSLGINLGVRKWISTSYLQPAPALGPQHGGYDLDAAGAVVQLLADHAGLGAVGQEPAEEQLDVGVVFQWIRVFGVDEGGHFGYTWKQ